MKIDNTLDELKKEYEKIKKKHKLPDFNSLNQEFDIEKLQDKETDFILREVRRSISDKIAAFLRFFELFLNPQSAPVFILFSMKNLSKSDKELIEKIYRELVSLELLSISRDIVYDETKEVAFIKHVVKRWQEIKPDLEKLSFILSKISKVQLNSEQKKKSYFG